MQYRELKLYLDNDGIGGIASHGQLSIYGTAESCGAPRTCPVNAAVMHNDHRTTERLSDTIGGSNVSGHVFRVIFGATKRPVEGIEHDQDRRIVLLFDGCD